MIYDQCVWQFTAFRNVIFISLRSDKVRNPANRTVSIANKNLNVGFIFDNRRFSKFVICGHDDD